ncbi:hypothetical protein AUK11_00660 [bacterium CG2_30_37_16]|nr:MAG: hypothetical protein AUK11_00660 [bacterium CG2_30_37_16]PIP30369.1 MAG: hypothetical protein COX25_05045 [bacterium (Candidatus Howlettbacteria) CG23_combo_of_CG06-09_8_20_14_all_37_9]PJB06975.1 MAG: hypothetical protein CO123_00935 [bacterium (Candidatus Howlettbacteria) CG_4_9_14_3_um_filter_37_10]
MAYDKRPRKLPTILNGTFDTSIEYNKKNFTLARWEKWEQEIYKDNPYYVQFMYDCIEKYETKLDLRIKATITAFIKYIAVFTYRILQAQCEINSLNDQFMGIDSGLLTNLPYISKSIYEFVKSEADSQRKFENLQSLNEKLHLFVKDILITINNRSKELSTEEMEYISRIVKVFAIKSYYLLYYQCIENKHTK